MAGSLYSTSRWQKTRRYVLHRDDHVCQIQGPGCRGVATTVHHLIPASERPDLFHAADSNLVAACTRCNYRHGQRLATTNRRRTVAQLQQTIFEQDQRIAQLVEKLARYENPDAFEPQPRIY